MKSDLFWRIKQIVHSGWDQSVVRRLISLLCFTLPAAGLNLGLSYFASHLLSSKDFGIYYTAIIAINILFAPSLVLNLFFSRFTANVLARHGLEQADRTLWLIVRLVAKWLGILSLVGLALILLFSVLGGKFSRLLALLIILVVYTSYLAETGRIVLQGTHRFIRLGKYTLGWMAIRFALAIGALWFFRTVWGGMVGIVMSAPIVFLWTFGIPRKNQFADSAALSQALDITALTPFAFSYGVFAAIAHADIVVAYLTMQPHALGVYSASSVLPKGLLMVSLPIVQLTFPMMVGRHAAVLPSTSIFLKGLLVTFALTAIGAIIIIALSEPVCNASYGIAACNSTAMAYGLVAIVVFCVIRFLISADFAANRDWLPTTLVVPLGLFGAYAFHIRRTTPVDLAQTFFLFSLIVLVFYSLLRVALPLAMQIRLQLLRQRQND